MSYLVGPRERPHWAWGILRLVQGPRTRNAALQRRIAALGWAGDQGGHLIALFLGGGNAAFNLVPQSDACNHGPFRRFENAARRALQAGVRVLAVLRVHYGRGGDRPTSFAAELWDASTGALLSRFARISNAARP